MKRVTLYLFVLLIVVLSAVLSGCGASPKARADEFVKYVPEEIGGWERDDKDTVKLLSSTVASKGHITMIYEGEDDALAYFVVEVHPSEDAAEVAITSRERELLLRGLVFDQDRAPQQATALVAQDGRARYALMQEGAIVVEINTLAADDETAVSDDMFAELLTVARNAYKKVLSD